MDVYISGEDPVTETTIIRLLNYVSPKFKVIQNIPARGGEIKTKVPQCNKLAKSTPVIMLLDVDEGCAPLLKAKLLQGLQQEPDFLINVSVDEAEAWLMADREGFANYFGIPIDKIPQAKPLKQGGRNARMEMDFPVKSSWLLTHQYALASSKAEVRKTIGVSDSQAHCKGKEYNTVIVPFIENIWNVDVACSNSDSLERMINRLQNLINSKKP